MITSMWSSLYICVSFLPHRAFISNQLEFSQADGTEQSNVWIFKKRAKKMSAVLVIDSVVSTIIGVSGFRTKCKYRHVRCIFFFIRQKAQNTSIKVDERETYGCKFDRRYSFFPHNSYTIFGSQIIYMVASEV